MSNRFIKSVLIILFTCIFFSSCGNYSEQKQEVKVAEQQTSEIEESESNNVDDVSLSSEAVENNVEFSGEWVCEDKNTTINLTIDEYGNVDGNIVTVVGEKVPSCQFKGVIENGQLEAELIDGESENYYSIGHILLTFLDENEIDGNIELDKSKAIYLELSEGNMVFLRY